MKHLKTYQIFESTDEIKSYIKNVFLELEDIGYEIEFRPTLSTTSIINHRKKYVLIIKKKDGFVIPEIVDPLEHAISYMSDVGFDDYQIDVRFYFDLYKIPFEVEDVDIDNLKGKPTKGGFHLIKIQDDCRQVYVLFTQK